MTRVNLDSEMRNDPRIRKLTRALGEHRLLVHGRLIEVWWLCYEGITDVLRAEDVDDAAELDGFAVAMVASRLAEQLDAGHVRIVGAAKRIGYRLKQVDAGHRGGEKRARTAERGPDGRMLPRRTPGLVQGAPGPALDEGHQADSRGRLDNPGEPPGGAGPASSPLLFSSSSPDTRSSGEGGAGPALDGEALPGEVVVEGIPVCADLAPELAQALRGSLGAWRPPPDVREPRRVESTRAASLAADRSRR